MEKFKLLTKIFQFPVTCGCHSLLLRLIGCKYWLSLEGDRWDYGKYMCRCFAVRTFTCQRAEVAT